MRTEEMTRWDSISVTAHYTAQVWARNGLPCAWSFDTRLGRLLYEAGRPFFAIAAQMGLSTPPDFLIQRHRIIDALVDQLAPAQLVELAGGLGPRCLAYSQKWQAHCIDADLPQLVQTKASLIGDRVPASYHQVALDLIASRDYGADLTALLRWIRPTVVITEGILPYFSPEQQQHVIDNVAGLLRQCGGGTYLVDIYHREEMDNPEGVVEVFRAGLELLARTRTSPFIASFEEGERMMHRAGFTRVIAHRPVDWQEALDLPRPRYRAGLCVYQASL